MHPIGIALRLRRRWQLAATGAILLVAVAALWTVLGSSHPAAAPAAQPATTVMTGGVASAQGLRVAIQPESGELVPPSPEQAAELEALGGQKPAEPMQIERLPDGTLMMQVGSQFDNYSVARVSANGIETRCVPDARSARRFVNDESGTAQPALEVR